MYLPVYLHLRDRICLGTPHDQVDTTAKPEGQSTIDPEQDDNCTLEPVSSLSIANRKLGNVCQYRAKRDDRGRDKERFGWMSKGGLESEWVPVEAQGYHDDVEDEEDKVGDEEDTCYSVLAVERVWDVQYHVC